MGVIRITSELQVPTEAVNVWHWITTGPPETADADQAIVKLDTFFTAITAFMRPGVWEHGLRVVTVDETPNRVVPATAQSTTTTGTTNAQAQAAAGITWQTAFIGKSYAGRSYLGPLAGGAVDSTGLVISNSFISALVTAAGDLITPTASDAVLGVWSEKLQAATPVTDFVVRTGLRTQRRRLT